MKKILLLLMGMLVVCATFTIAAVRPRPLMLGTGHIVASVKNTSTLQYWSGTHYNISYGNTILDQNDMSSSYSESSTANGATGHLYYTDYYGTVNDVEWTLNGSTLSFSVHVTPGADMQMGLHRFAITDQYTFDTLADDDYEDGDGLHYGPEPWCYSGSVELNTTTNAHYALTFENLTNGLYDENKAGFENLTVDFYFQP